MGRLRFAATLPLLASLPIGCQVASAPDGGRGTVVAQAYIDRDASGTLTIADLVLGSFGVSLIFDGSTVETQSTDATGRATFPDLAPARYRVQATGTAPAGTVLTTNPEPTATIPFRGGADTVDFRFAYFPGSVSGRVFRDDNANGTYDPGVDTPGSGLYVLLRRASTVVDSVTTDASGSYTFARVAPGDYSLQFEKPSTIDYGASGATRQITVAPNVALTNNAVFTGSLVIPIASARGRAVGAVVTVAGTLTVPPNVFTSGAGLANSEIWLQDQSGGIAVFSVPSTSTLALADNVVVTGTLGTFSGQLQIQTNPTVTRTGAGTPVTPVSLTVAQANARGTNEGRLVSVASVRIVTVPTGTAAAFTVTGQDAATGEPLQIRVNGVTTGLTRTSFVVGNEYRITGVLTQFNGTAQIKPRFATDVSGPVPIATARAAPVGTVVTVSGSITVPPNSITSGTGGVNSEIWVQDATGGIAVFSVPSTSTLALGDRVEVTGTIGLFSGQLQLQTNPVVTFKATGTPPAPLTVTGTEFNALTQEGKLVQLAVTITTVPGGTGAAFTVTATAADGQAIQIRVAAATTGLTRASFTVGNQYTVKGVLSQFNGTAQLKPRFAADVTP